MYRYNLNIIIDLSPESKGYRNLTLILILPIIFISFLILLINFIWAFLVLIIVSIGISPFFILYLFYRNRTKEWILDRQSHKIIHNQLTPSKKSLKQLSFSEIEYLIYTNYKWGAHTASIYSLKFHLNNMEEVQIFVGFKDKCEELGIIIAEFLEKPLYKNIVGIKEKIL